MGGERRLVYSLFHRKKYRPFKLSAVHSFSGYRKSGRPGYLYHFLFMLDIKKKSVRFELLQRKQRSKYEREILTCFLGTQNLITQKNQVLIIQAAITLPPFIFTSTSSPSLPRLSLSLCENPLFSSPSTPTVTKPAQTS